MPGEPGVIVPRTVEPAAAKAPQTPAGPQLRALIPRLVVPGPAFRVAQDRRREVQASQFRLLPFSAICRIQIKFPGINQPYQGTGFLVDPGLVLTAAHVLNDPEHGPAEQAVVTPGCLADKVQSAPDLRYEQVVDRGRIRTNVNWGRPDYRPDNDYGAILLPDASLFSGCGHFRLKSVSDESLSSHASRGTDQFVVAGFPVDKTNGERLWYERGSLLAPAHGFIRHLIDTTSGQSGSPLAAIIVDEITQQKVPVVLGIHSRGGSDQTYNVAVRVDDRLIEWVELRKKELEILNRH